MIENQVGLLSEKEVQWHKPSQARKLAFVVVCVCVIVIVSTLCAISWRPGIEKKTFVISALTIPKAGLRPCSNELRVSTASAFCDRHKTSRHQEADRKEHKSRYRHILVDERHKLLYCVIPGTGYSSILALLVHHAGLDDLGEDSLTPSVYSTEDLADVGLRYLNTYRLDDIHRKLASYYKFVLVRHPFVRLKSAFSDLFVSGTGPGSWKYDDVITDFFGKKRLTFVYRHPKITFYQFLQLVIASKEFQDSRWKTYYSMCHPCHIGYDAILKLETIQNDIRLIDEKLEASGAGNESTLEGFWKDKNVMKYNVTTKVFQTVPSTLMERLLKHFKKDFAIFGYAWDEKAGLECTSGREEQQQCC